MDETTRRTLIQALAAAARTMRVKGDESDIKASEHFDHADTNAHYYDGRRDAFYAAAESLDNAARGLEAGWTPRNRRVDG